MDAAFGLAVNLNSDVVLVDEIFAVGEMLEDVEFKRVEAVSAPVDESTTGESKPFAKISHAFKIGG